MFLLCFPKELERLRSQIQLQSAEISKLQTENQKLQVLVPVKTCLFSLWGLNLDDFAFLSFRKDYCFKNAIVLKMRISK